MTEIKLYLTPESSWSQKAVQWLKKKKIPFQERDVSESDHYRDELLQKSSQVGVPILEIDSQVLVGFHEKVWEETFKKIKL